MPPSGRVYTVSGRTGTVSELAGLFGIHEATVRTRLRQGVDPERAFQPKPMYSAKVYVTKDGETGTAEYFAEKYGVPKKVMRNRLDQYASPTLNGRPVTDSAKLAAATGMTIRQARVKLKSTGLPVDVLVEILPRMRPKEHIHVVTYFGRTMLLREARELAGIPTYTFDRWLQKTGRVGDWDRSDLTDDAGLTDFLQMFDANGRRRVRRNSLYLEASRKLTPRRRQNIVLKRLDAGWTLEEAMTTPVLDKHEANIMRMARKRREGLALAGIIIE